MGKLDSLKNGQARGGFKPKKVNIGIPSDTPMAEESVETVVLNEEPTIPEDVKVIKPAPKSPEKKAEKKTSTKKASTPKTKAVDISRYNYTEDTKTRRLNIGLHPDLVTYIKFKALRTGIPQYKLLTEIIATALVNAKNKHFKYNTPELEPYKTRQSSPTLYGFSAPVVLLDDVKEYSRELLLTPTQFYVYAISEAKKADVDFEY